MSSAVIKESLSIPKKHRVLADVFVTVLDQVLVLVSSHDKNVITPRTHPNFEGKERLQFNHVVSNFCSR
jgi:hypothetical protein